MKKTRADQLIEKVLKEGTHKGYPQVCPDCGRDLFEGAAVYTKGVLFSQVQDDGTIEWEEDGGVFEEPEVYCSNCSAEVPQDEIEDEEE